MLKIIRQHDILGLAQLVRRFDRYLCCGTKPGGIYHGAARSGGEVLAGSGSPSSDGKGTSDFAIPILFDGGLVVDYLKKVKSWLDAHPNEVLTLLVTNPDNVSLRDVWKPAFDSSGVTPLTYVPPTNPMKRGDWPTLGSLIDSGKRVIVFMDSGADGAGVDFILPQFKMIWEPPFSSTDPNFPCSVDRNEGPLSVTDHMHMLNHNLNVNIIPIGDGVLVADRANAARTNSVSSIMANAGGCAPLAAGKAPNFVMLDWVNVGEGMKAVNMLNGFA
uniref:PLC-like phosphodiesterase n=1 Tax=Moniliophthora roreri TaxID=221103 RepID=A0A0W0EW13_MONRR